MPIYATLSSPHHGPKTLRDGCKRTAQRSDKRPLSQQPPRDCREFARGAPVPHRARAIGLAPGPGALPIWITSVAPGGRSRTGNAPLSRTAKTAWATIGKQRS